MVRKALWWTIGVFVVLLILVMAWSKGGSQPMRWIEEPVSAAGVSE